MSQSAQTFQPLSTAASEYNGIYSIIKSILSGINTATVAQVISVTNNGALAPVGYVDLQPLVNLLSPNGQPTTTSILHNVPYFRLQGGGNGVIIDPQAGDIGVVVFADRDISSVKANKGQSNPGSLRQFDLTDGLYFGGVLNGALSQYLQFNEDGIAMLSSAGMTLTAPLGLVVNADTQVNDTLSTAGNLVAGSGASGSFTTMTGQVVTVQDGIITNIF